MVENPPLAVIASDAHRVHAPKIEVAYGQAVAMYEVPQRADLIAARLAEDDAFEFHAPTDHGTAPIEAVHDLRLIRFLETAWQRFQDEVHPLDQVFPDVMWHPALFDNMANPTGPIDNYPSDVGAQLGYWCWETNTALTKGTYAAARSSIDIALSALDLVDSTGTAAYGLCRPPGHHAPRSAYGGYCYFNNAAVAAQSAIARGRHRVAIVDVDYHHGNGTQQIFWHRPDVLYVSLHGHPQRAYPYVTGGADEIGDGAGVGTNLNLPLPAETDDDAYLQHLTCAADRVVDFGADLVIISLGLDTSIGDPLGDLRLTTAGMSQCGELLGQLNTPTLILQEGGYDLNSVGEDAHGWLRGFQRGFSSTS